MRKWFKKDYWLEPLPFYRAALWIFFTTLLISGSAFFGLIYYKHIQEIRTHDSKYAIRGLIQNCCGGFELPTLYFTEMLNLSADTPDHLYKWVVADGEAAIRKSPYIKSASIERIPPDTVKISYVSRIPVASVADIKDAWIDQEGVLLPQHPLFGEKQLTKFILGMEKPSWGVRMNNPEVVLALQIKKLAEKEFPKQTLSAIDVSRAFARSAGKRQAIVVFEAEGNTHVLRLTAKNYWQQLANYKELLKSGSLASSKFTVIDLRLNHLAYLTQGEPNDGIH